MSEKFRATAQQEDRPFMQTAARISSRTYRVQDKDEAARAAIGARFWCGALTLDPRNRQRQ